MPMEWRYEPLMPKEFILGMKARGHAATVLNEVSVVTAISNNKEIFSAVSERRRPGNTSYLLLPTNCT
ncbi:unnamed protein product [Nezara viridula]|uniref:Uncharacterized protein n=1 Tax=Nezara viridula TaxID=85310 RepID=A0A9P0HMA3_NEZVI|nr:unnamed protein product [Nezara viridula]